MTALALAQGSTVETARRMLAHAFRDHGIDTPDLDARLLTGHALGLNHAELALARARDLTSDEIVLIVALARRRLKREPVARILGRKEFWSRSFVVTDAVLVPRPETETVVEAALAAVDATEARSHALRILDIGTGSGALLLALLGELPNAFGIGTDRDRSAIEVARRNSERFGLSTRSALVVGDYGKPLAGGFDLVVANPPYVDTDEIARLPREVRDYDPRLALDGGIKGLDAYCAIAADAVRLLAPGGHLCVEIGAGQTADVQTLLATSGLQIAQPVVCDLAGIPRALLARKNA
jgi:release factor glutamine methyltransferase